MTKVALTAHIARCVKGAPSDAIAKALGALVAARLRKRQIRPEQRWGMDLAKPGKPHWEDYMQQPKPATQRRSPRRLGRVKFYDPTTKPNFTRTGTWTHHMIAVIKAHADTNAATRANESCDNPKWASKRLDFNWAADNGYIIWR